MSTVSAFSQGKDKGSPLEHMVWKIDMTGGGIARIQENRVFVTRIYAVSSAAAQLVQLASGASGFLIVPAFTLGSGAAQDFLVNQWIYQPTNDIGSGASVLIYVWGIRDTSV